MIKILSQVTVLFYVEINVSMNIAQERRYVIIFIDKFDGIVVYAAADM